MSSNICRNTYINYGSYLRSRGYDQQICQLVTDLDNGLLPVSGFTFGGANSATFSGPLTINDFNSNDGKLTINGGANNVVGSFGIQCLNSMFVNGSIVQTTSNTTYSGEGTYTSGNVFRSTTHNFTDAGGSNCNVAVNGTLTTSSHAIIAENFSVTNGIFMRPDRTGTAFTINDSGDMAVSGSFTSSDDLLKHNETTITNGLSIVNQLNPVKYDRSIDIDTSDNLLANSGYIAQEVYSIDDLSHNVNVGGYDSSNNYKIWSVNYNGLMPYHTSAIKELNNTITNLTNTINTQSSVISVLQSEIESLKSRVGALET